MYYSLRITTSNYESLKEFLGKYVNAYVLAREVGSATSKTHYHLYIETLTEAATLRLNIRKRFGSGNSNYSMKKTEKDPVEYISYIIKDGEYETHNIEDSFFSECQNYDLKVKNEIIEKKAKKSSRQNIMFSYIDEKILEYPFQNEEYEVLRSRIAKALIQYYIQENLLIRNFQIKSQLDTYLIRKYPIHIDEFISDKIL